MLRWGSRFVTVLRCSPGPLAGHLGRHAAAAGGGDDDGDAPTAEDAPADDREWQRGDPRQWGGKIGRERAM